MDPDSEPDWIRIQWGPWTRIQWGPWIRIRIQKGKNEPLTYTDQICNGNAVLIRIQESQTIDRSALLRIHEILVRIRIRGSIPLTNGSGFVS
jgi:hypothetical protein